MITTVTHKDGSKVFLDTETKEWFRFPKVIAHNFAPKDSIIINNKYFTYFETIKEFLNSDKKRSIVPVFVIEKKPDGMRMKTTILSGGKNGEFFNVERINGKWVRNETDELTENNAYYLSIEKNKQSDNQCIIKKSKKI